SVRREQLRFTTNGVDQELSIDVLPFKGSLGEPCFIILFDRIRDAARSKVEAPESAALGTLRKEDLVREILHLRERNDTGQAYQKAMIEKSEASIEELRTANEEVLSANEE